MKLSVRKYNCSIYWVNRISNTNNHFKCDLSQKYVKKFDPQKHKPIFCTYASHYKCSESTAIQWWHAKCMIVSGSRPSSGCSHLSYLWGGAVQIATWRGAVRLLLWDEYVKLNTHSLGSRHSVLNIIEIQTYWKQMQLLCLSHLSTSNICRHSANCVLWSAICVLWSKYNLIMPFAIRHFILWREKT